VREIPADLDREVVGQIDQRLAAVASSQGVVVRWAVESGSRAWGFPSPDSDYDCRFIYVRPARDYLTPWLPADFVETPLDRVLDVNGWDLRKAVDLMVRGNATVLEWLRSPIIYSGSSRFRDHLLDLAAQVSEPELLARHYAHVGRQQWERSGGTAAGAEEPVRLKGLFYSLRPAATLHWMRAHPELAVPPMRLQDLLEQAPPPPSVTELIGELVASKARTREMGVGFVPSPVREFIISKLYAPGLEGTGHRRVELRRARAIAAAAFREALEERTGDPGP
jgi:predicted nucleotidyltransferase